ncbi:hypothetical protein FACS1894181_08530 [Bacteroidia bacterium]|nr:hypothetical protein FACS1894181_08530 [Bacteroidia bacterium]
MTQKGGGVPIIKIKHGKSSKRYFKRSHRKKAVGKDNFGAFPQRENTGKVFWSFPAAGKRQKKIFQTFPQRETVKKDDLEFSRGGKAPKKDISNVPAAGNREKR